MLFTVNVKMLHMLEKIKSTEILKNNLEKLLFTTKPSYNYDDYFTTLAEWVTDVEKFEKLDTSEILNLESSLITFYDLLKSCTINFNILDKTYTCLKLKHEEHYVASENGSILDLFSRLRDAFCFKWKTTEQLLLRSDITKDELKELYDAALKCNTTMCEFIHYLEQTMLNHYAPVWEENVFNSKMLTNISKAQKIAFPTRVIVSFCEDTSKYLYSSQKMISASLHTTISKESYQNRKFGFMYDFSPDTLIAMSTDDAQSATFPIVPKTSFVNYIMQGTPLATADTYFEISPVRLKPIYKFEDFVKYTYKYNEILLKPEAIPYGVFVFRDALDKYRITVYSVCIAQHLPLFICNEDGSMNYVPYQILHDVLDNRGEQYGL